ncbi:MAG: FprA family A-type flavoprotein [bacterium]|nr:FprA family A-type flavoprotein [bacterium]
MNTTLRDGIDWVGFVDWNVRDFHGYITKRGSTYNAYLIQDKKIALIDTVKGPFSEHLLNNIRDIIGNRKIDYLVCNHSELDHAGSIPAVMSAYPDAVVVCTAKCEKTLAMHFDTSGWKFQAVKTGDSLSLGNRTLTFIETPMVHWPESMFTYMPEEKILFSMDAFGQHYATSNRFDDEVDLDAAMFEAKVYYASIVMLYNTQVRKVLEAAGGLKIEIIATAHGVIWRSHIGKIIEAYKEWSSERFRRKVVVMYDTMWNSTEKMAEAIYEGALIPGVEVSLIHIRKTDLASIAYEIIDAAGVAFGSAILNLDIMPTAHAVLSYLNGLKATGRAGLAFGSYGWSAGAVDEIENYFRKLKWESIREPIRSNFSPTPEILAECRKAGRELAEKAYEIGSS